MHNISGSFFTMSAVSTSEAVLQYGVISSWSPMPRPDTTRHDPTQLHPCCFDMDLILGSIPVSFIIKCLVKLNVYRFYVKLV